MLYTSGTTARPKGVTHTHISLIAAAELMSSLGLDETHTFLAATQMLHISALAGVAPTTYTVTVNSKRIRRGKTTKFLLDLGPWGPKMKSNTLRVGRATYEPIQPGDTVILDLRRGALDVNWYLMRSWQRGN
jgi:long-subunit acyl-CoA synthetase (AMP-forming)